MKKRKLETKVYNFIQKRQIVPFPDLAAKFGTGKYYISSPYDKKAVTAGGLSEELQDALFNLRQEASIFEVAVPAELYLLINQEIPLKSDLTPIARFNRPRYRYGFSGLSWLPAMYCSNTGLKNLALTYYNVLEIPRPEKIKFITDIDNVLKGPQEDRLILNCYLSDLLSGNLSMPFRTRLQERVRKVQKIGEEEYQKMLENAKVKFSKTHLVGI
jgi:hypothetical protein